MHKMTSWPTEKSILYQMILSQAKELIADCPPVSALANVSALLWDAFTNINWVGFYLKKGDILHLGPFQGKTACVAIPIGRGVCGTAAAERAVQLVPDVHQFPGHIACDSASNAEIVVPILKNGELLGVLDIDSPVFGRFDSTDATSLTQLSEILSYDIDWSNGLL